MSEKIEDILEQYLKGEDVLPAGKGTEEAMAAFRQFQGRRDAALKRRKRIWLWTAAVSAAACIAIVAGIAFRSQTPAPEEVFIASAPVGEIVNVTLPDGTAVWLNGSSRISCSKEFGVKDRAVSLEGEGYFEVVRNESLPMVISTASASVTVLGTTFDFREYPEDAEASVVLYEGHVNFTDAAGKGLDLLPGQAAMLDKASGELAYVTTDTSHPAAWRNGLLIFEDCTLERICRDLSNAYGTAIKISDPALLQLRFTAEFNVRTQTLSDVLEVLSLTRHISFRLSETGAEIF